MLPMELNEIIGNAKRIVICGLGNEKYGDEAFGVIVAKLLKPLILNPDVTVIECHEIPEKHAGPIIRFKPDLLLLISPINYGGKAGKLVVADPWEALEDLPETLQPQLRVTLNHLRELLPDTRFMLLGCQIKDNRTFRRLSPEVKDSAKALVLSLKKELEKIQTS